jgi:hypothetical protein
MLGRIRAELQTALRSRGVPVVVEYGPVVTSRMGELADIVVLEHDPAGDAVGAPKAIGGIPRRRFSYTQRFIARVHGKSTAPGSRRQDHETRCNRIVEQVLIGLDDVIRGSGTTWRCTGGRFAPFAAAGEQPQGASYELRFEVDAGVFDRVWSDADPPTAEIGGDGGVNITSRTMAGDESDAPLVMACGAEDEEEP